MNSSNICVIYGSVRTNRQGIRAAYYILRVLEARGHSVSLIDPVVTPLPLLDKMYKEYPEGEAPENMKKIAGLLREADGFIVVTGEYNHGIPPALKNLLDHFQKEYFFKPSGILSYSAGRYGGIREAIQLRITLAELGTVAIPTILSVPQVHKTMDENGEVAEEFIIRQTGKFINEFEWYCKALARQRKEGLPY